MYAILHPHCDRVTYRQAYPSHRVAELLTTKGVTGFGLSFKKKKSWEDGSTIRQLVTNLLRTYEKLPC